MIEILEASEGVGWLMTCIAIMNRYQNASRVLDDQNMDMCRIGIDTYVRKKDSTMELESLKSSSE